MQIGDKVKFINENLEGVVTRLIDDKMVGVSVEDGFEIPVLKREVMITTPINAVEQHDKKKIEAAEKINIGESEISVWFEQSSQTWYKAHLLNNSRSDILLSVTVKQNKVYKPLFGGRVEKHTSYLFNTLNLAELEAWGTYCFRIIFHENEALLPRAPWYLEYTFKAKDFMKPREVNGKVAYLIALKPEKIEQFTLSDQKENAAPKPIQDQYIMHRPEEVIDLHLEKLSENTFDMNAEEALNLQLQHFKNEFEKAIALKYSKITFIHGVGNGTLKQKIWKEVSGHGDVKTFSEARKEKFGYGATEIILR